MFNRKNKFAYTIFMITLTLCVIMCFSTFAEPTTTVPVSHFIDVNEDDWFYNDIKYVSDTGLMNGTDTNIFSPGETTKRGMIVTILWRMEKKPIEKASAFLDVQNDAYYYDAVNWAYANKIVKGYSETTFNPEAPVTREQLATIIYNYTIYKNYDTSRKISLSKFADTKIISSYAVPALEWSTAYGIIAGTPQNMLTPQNNTLRCETAAILHRFCRLFESTSTDQKPNLNENIQTSVNQNNTADSTNSRPGKNTVSETQKKSPMLVINDASAVVGEKISLSVSIRNNPGILGMILTLLYDDTSLVIESIENGEAFHNVLNLTSPKILANGVKFAWDGIDLSSDDIQDGNILHLNIKILDTAKTGKYPITLIYSDGDIVDYNLKNLSIPITNSHITVTN